MEVTVLISYHLCIFYLPTWFVARDSVDFERSLSLSARSTILCSASMCVDVAQMYHTSDVAYQVFLEDYSERYNSKKDYLLNKLFLVERCRTISCIFPWTFRPHPLWFFIPSRELPYRISRTPKTSSQRCFLMDSSWLHACLLLYYSRLVSWLTSVHFFLFFNCAAIVARSCAF